MRRRLLISGLLTGALAIGVVAPVSAAAPLVFGPSTDTYSGYAWSCDGFDVSVDGTLTSTTYVFLDQSTGSVTRVVRRTSAPHDTLTNMTTGRSIVVRGHFDETMVPIPGTDEATKTITGFRYMVNEPGSGVTVADVGRIVYGDFEQTLLLSEAGRHDAVTDQAISDALCAAVA
jgi:hypothetical protein